MNNTAKISSTYSIIFLPWSSAFGENCWDSYLSVNRLCKRLIFGHMHIISLPWKTFRCKYTIFPVLLNKSMRNPKTQFAHFSYLFFSWRQIVDWDVWKSSANSRVLLCGLLSIVFLQASWPRSAECSSLGLSLNDIWAEWNFGNQFPSWRSVKARWF